MQANYWVGQMHCGPPNQTFGWAMAHTAAHPHPYDKHSEEDTSREMMERRYHDERTDNQAHWPETRTCYGTQPLQGSFPIHII